MSLELVPMEIDGVARPPTKRQVRATETIDRLLRELNRARFELADCQTALRYYADLNRWTTEWASSPDGQDMKYDRGRIARQALGLDAPIWNPKTGRFNEPKERK